MSIEAPHLLRMIERVEFDTIYHEHFSYFSLLAARDVLRRGRVARLRRRGAVHARRQPAHLGLARRRRRGVAGDGRRRARARGGARGWAGLARGLRLVRAAGSSGCSTSCARFLAEAKADGQARGRLCRRGEGQHAAQYGRRLDGRDRLRRRPQPAQAGALPARARTYPCSTPSTCARTSRTTCCCSPGTCGTRSSSRWPTCASGAGSSSCRCRACR